MGELVANKPALTDTMEIIALYCVSWSMNREKSDLGTYLSRRWPEGKVRQDNVISVVAPPTGQLGAESRDTSRCWGKTFQRLDSINVLFRWLKK